MPRLNKLQKSPAAADVLSAIHGGFFEIFLQYSCFYYILFFCTVNRQKGGILMGEKKKATLLALLRAAVAMAIFVLAVVNYEKLRNIDVRAIVDSSASIAVAVCAILGIYFIKSVLFIIPASLIYISVGMAFTPWQAILINLCGIIIEVTATYLLGVFLGGDYVTRLLQKNKAGRKLLEKKFNDNFPVLLGLGRFKMWLFPLLCRLRCRNNAARYPFHNSRRRNL